MVTILIIEDDDTIAFGIKSFLLKNNYRVIHGKNLELGKELLKIDIDLILLDLNLPDGSGFDFCKYVKKLKIYLLFFLLSEMKKVQ